VDKKSKVSVAGATGGSSRNLWVSGLSSSTRATDLKQVFSKYGKVRHSTVVVQFDLQLHCLCGEFSVFCLHLWFLPLFRGLWYIHESCMCDTNNHGSWATYTVWITHICICVTHIGVCQGTQLYAGQVQDRWYKDVTCSIHMTFFVSAGYRRQSGDKCSYAWCQMLWLCDYGDKRWCFKMHSASAQDRTAWADDICWTGEPLCSSFLCQIAV